MPANHFVAFDLGAESGRAIIATLNDGKLTLEAKHRFANPTAQIGGHLHWNFLSQWEELKTGLAKCAGTEAATKIKLSGIGVDTWGVDFGLLTGDGDLLGMPMHYRDSRTDGLMDAAFARVSRKDIFNATGSQFMQLNTLYQILALKKQSPRLLSAAETMLFIPDLFNYFFTGQKKCEFSVASTSQMMEPRTGRWAEKMLEKFELPMRILPEIVPSGTVIGNLLPEIATACGVDVMPVIAPACHDTASAVAAVPAEGDNWCYISSGTWSLMGVELPKPRIDEQSLEFNYTNEGGVGGSIRFLKNIMGLWLVQQCRKQFAIEGYDHSYSEITQMAERANGFAACLDLDHNSFFFPGDMPAKIEQYCKKTNQRPPTMRGDYVRTCLESLALTYRKTLEGLEKMLGRKIETIHIVGGGSQNELLNQMTADACGRPVVAGPIEATAAGNVLVQAMGIGLVKSMEDLRAIVRRSFEPKHYEPRDTAKWEAAYARFRALPKV